MLTGPFTPDELARYAEVAIGRCLDMREGELVLLRYEHEHRPLGVALARAAFRRGLRVETWVADPLIGRAELDLAADGALGAVTPWAVARLLARTEPGQALVVVDGSGDPRALEGCAPDRLALRARRLAEQGAELFARLDANRDASLVLGYPTAAWAAQAYPELPPDRASRALAEDLLHFARLGAEDGAGAEGLEGHLAALRERAALANGLRLRGLRFRGPGTDLQVGLTEDALWNCAEETNAHGRTIVYNLPTEEIYTSPAALATEGTMRCTTPLAHGGSLFEDLRAEFAGGRLVRLDARTEAQRDTLLGLLDVDEGGRRLGEVALVDASSRIGSRARVYWNTLLDENQACHVAFGLGFASCRREGGRTADLNRSRTHIDVMIGAPEVEVTGITAAGRTLPLIVDGVWRPA